jgi:hypothetical protein
MRQAQEEARGEVVPGAGEDNGLAMPAIPYVRGCASLRAVLVLNAESAVAMPTDHDATRLPRSWVSRRRLAIRLCAYDRDSQSSTA